MLEESDVYNTIVGGTTDQLAIMIEEHPELLKQKFSNGNDRFSTALTFAVKSNDTAKVTLLLERGASVEQDTLGLIHCWLNTLGYDETFDEQLLATLVEHGVTFPDSTDGCSYFISLALDPCFRDDNIELFDCLLRHGFDPVACEKTGELCALTTALCYVEEDDATRIARRMMELGCDLVGFDEYYFMPPLLQALRNELYDTCRQLLAHGANPKLPFEDPEGLGVDVAHLLVSQPFIPVDVLSPIFSASINLDDIRDGDPLIHQASSHSNTQLISYLIENGADINSRNKKGNTPIMCAVKLGDKNTVVHLIEAGADVNLANKNNATALDMANKKKSLKKIASVIAEAGGVATPKADTAAINKENVQIKGSQEKKAKKIKMDQYCVVNHSSAELNDALFNFTDACDGDFWDESHDIVLNKLTQAIGLLGPAATRFLETRRAEERRSIIRILSMMDYLPATEECFYASFTHIKSCLLEDDFPLLKGERVRANIEELFMQLGANKVKFLSESKHDALRRKAVMPLVEGLVDSISGKTSVDSIVTSMFDFLKPPSNADELQAALSEGITDEVIAMAQLTPESGAQLPSDARKDLAMHCCAGVSTDVDHCLEQFVSLTALLTSFDERFQDGELMELENADPFRELKEQCSEFIHGDNIHKHFCQYFRSVLDEISKEPYLGSAIQRFDHALYFSDLLIGYLEVEDAAHIMSSGIQRYEDFEAWVNYFVLQAYQQLLEDDQAA